MKDNKLKLQETRVVAVVADFGTVSFCLSYIVFKTQQPPERL